MKRLLALTALCLPLYLFAQGFGSFSHDQPFFAKDRTSGTTIPAGLFYWWLASDVTNTVGSRVPQWIDRVQNVAITNGTATKQPTNRVDGVEFNGTQYLVKSPIWYLNTNTYTLFTVIFWAAPNRDYNQFYAYGNGTHSEWLGSVDTATAYTAGARWGGKVGAAYYGNGPNPSSVPTNQWTVLATTHTTAESDANFIRYVDGTPTKTNSLYHILSDIGGTAEGNFGLVGKIREIRLYTNVMSDLEITNLSYELLNP